MSTSIRSRLQRSPAAAVLAAALLLAGCSDAASSDSGTPDKGIPSQIKLLGIRNQTGPVSYTGISAAKGTALAIKQIAAEGFLGADTKITIKERDSAFDPGTAANEITSGLASRDTTAVLGPQVSSEALAVAPIAQKSGVPIIYTQSGIDGLLDAGDMQFRASPPQKTIWPTLTQDIIDKGFKRIAIFNTATNPTYHELGTKVVPDLLNKGGASVAKSLDLEGSVSDFRTPVSSILSTKPDAVIVTLVGSQIPTLLVQLRQAGYTGPVYTGALVTDKELAATGSAAVGLKWVANYSPAATGEGPAKFTAAYKAEYGELPDAYAAEAFDATWWLVRAIKKAGSVQHEAVAAALAEVGKEGFVGAQGPLTFDNGNDARSKGLLVEWDGKQQTIAAE